MKKRYLNIQLGHLDPCKKKNIRNNKLKGVKAFN